ncbi:MAG: Maf family nucleotide pyrophosphatase [Rhodoferax sp.]|nr:Maf family nucleotide pyrophosphatase [Rhodoferax sp.]
MLPFIYLASQSPRRSQLLDQLGVAHALLLPGPEEDAEALEALRAGETPAAYVARVSLLKLDAALRRRRARGLRAAPVLCADTTVALGRRILGKPADAAEAKCMLHDLAGRTHQVLTAVAVGNTNRQLQSVSVSRVRLAPMSADAIRSYVASGEPMGKAGAYAVQGRVAGFIEHISGSYSGIMGLPLFETAQMLRGLGLRV